MIGLVSLHVSATPTFIAAAACCAGRLQRLVDPVQARLLQLLTSQQDYRPMVKWIRSMELIADYHDIDGGQGGWRTDLLHYRWLAPI
jgi:hypothetical protein